jgi:phage-related protein
MTTRLYDYIITVANTAPFKNGNNFIGVGSGTYGYIANVNHATGNIKVKVSNVYQEYQVNEVVTSNHYLISNTAATQSFTSTLDTDSFTLTGTTIPLTPKELSIYVGGVYQPTNNWEYISSNTSIHFFAYAKPGANTVVVRRDTGNTFSPSFSASALSLGNNQASTSTTISAITNSTFIRSRNAFTQPPVVRLVTFYYPGEWYPPNEKGNPSGSGTGLSWPAEMPWRIAEVIGDIHSDLNYNVTFGTESYVAYPMESDGIGTSSDGTLDRVTIRVSNYDNVITNFIENPYLVGNVTSNSAVGYVNGELLNGLDPATVVGHSAYNQTTVDSYYGGKTNVSWSYTRAVAAGYVDSWKNLKYDSRDFLGGVVEIKSTLASHLQYWPEYSKLSNLQFSNLVQVYNSAPYRVGDNVRTTTSNTDVYVVSLFDDNNLLLNAPLSNASTEQPLYIINSDHDPEAYVRDVFKITELTALNENFAEFSLTSWLQYFKLTLPKRKFYKNTCQWEYKGSECQYPGPNGGVIPGTFPAKSANVNPITTSNEIGVGISDDDCAKSYEACKVRNNTVHYGAFPGTGRQVPRQ